MAANAPSRQDLLQQLQPSRTDQFGRMPYFMAQEAPSQNPYQPGQLQYAPSFGQVNNAPLLRSLLMAASMGGLAAAGRAPVAGTVGATLAGAGLGYLMNRNMARQTQQDIALQNQQAYLHNQQLARSAGAQNQALQNLSRAMTGTPDAPSGVLSGPVIDPTLNTAAQQQQFENQQAVLEAYRNRFAAQEGVQDLQGLGDLTQGTTGQFPGGAAIGPVMPQTLQQPQPEGQPALQQNPTGMLDLVGPPQQQGAQALQGGVQQQTVRPVLTPEQLQMRAIGGRYSPVPPQVYSQLPSAQQTPARVTGEMADAGLSQARTVSEQQLLPSRIDALQAQAQQSRAQASYTSARERDPSRFWQPRQPSVGMTRIQSVMEYAQSLRMPDGQPLPPEVISYMVGNNGELPPNTVVYDQLGNPIVSKDSAPLVRRGSQQGATQRYTREQQELMNKQYRDAIKNTFGEGAY